MAKLIITESCDHVLQAHGYKYIGNVQRGNESAKNYIHSDGLHKAVVYSDDSYEHYQVHPQAGNVLTDRGKSAFELAAHVRHAMGKCTKLDKEG